MTSIYEQNRINGLYQVDEQRNAILDAAEKLFLQKGLENTTIGDIANETGIHRVTLYRYFPDRGPIAFEIAVRMLKKIKSSTDVSEQSVYLLAIKEDTLAMIDQFGDLRDAYRFLGMFDHLYGDHYPNETLAAWFKEQVNAMRWGKGKFQGEITGEIRAQVVMLLNVIMSFLEKMAARGDLMAGEQEVPLDDELKLFKRMVCVYIDDLLAVEKENGL
jgi:AcrR family transcriptional regulator